MAYLIYAVLAVLAIADTFALDLSLAPGLSVKNAMLNLVAGVLILQKVMGAPIRFELRTLQLWFGVLIGYALFTLLVIVFVTHFPPGYRWIEGVMRLKIDLIDNAIFFAVAFYGIRTAEEAKTLTRLMLIALTVMNFVSIGDVIGIFDIGVNQIGDNGEEAGRVFGTFGHPNGTAAVIVTLLPAYVAVAYTRGGLMKYIWLGGALISTVLLMMTASRGALVGLAVGTLWGVILCRAYFNFAYLGRWVIAGIAAVAVLVPLTAILSSGHENVLVDRIMTFDVATGGSGRDVIWRTAVNRMMATPLSLITGFGWNAYNAMGYYLAPHNQYLWLWFELGIIGVLSYVLLIRQAVATARSALPLANAVDRQYLIALVVGLMILSVTLFFTMLYKPWAYIWMYIGATLRLAVVQRRAVTAVTPAKSRAALAMGSSGRGISAR